MERTTLEHRHVGEISAMQRHRRCSRAPIRALVLAALALLLFATVAGCGRKVDVPKLVGMPYPEALQTLRDANLKLGTVEFALPVAGVAGNTVVQQSTAPGTSVKKDTKIGLTLAGGIAPATVPDVGGKTLDAASTALAGAGLSVGKIETVNDEKAAPDTVIEQNPAASTQVPPGSQVDLKVSRGVVVVTVPNVVGKTQADAEKLLKDSGFSAKTTEVYSDKPSGQVTDQSPVGGSSLNEGGAVTLSVSQGPLPMAVVPDVVGRTEADATQALQAAGFVAKSNQAYSDSVPAGTVVAQTPPSGVYAKKGAAVEVTVSLGTAAPDAVTIPDVSGKTQDEATQALEAAGFKVEVLGALSDTVPEGSVIGQAPSAGLSSPPGAIVTIAVSQGPPPTGQPLPTTTSTS